MMTSDPPRPQDHPERRDPGGIAHGDAPDSQQTLELLAALARQRQPPAAPAAPTATPAPGHPEPSYAGESPLDELARLIGQKAEAAVRHGPAPMAPETEPSRARPAALEPIDLEDLEPEFPAAAAPPPRRMRARRLLPSRRASFAIGTLLVVAVAAAGAASVWWSLGGSLTPQTATAEVLAKAMAECDADAAKTPDTLNFLVIPLTTDAANLAKWTSGTLQHSSDSYLLLSSADALAGLRDGSLKPYAGKFAFSVVEPNSGTRHSWPPTAGPTKFSEADAGNLTAIRLGFAFTDPAGEPQLSPVFQRQKGNCYWVMALVR